jgi:phosphatidylglycerol:prolipoprotein diacylglycerol transferase
VLTSLSSVFCPLFSEPLLAYWVHTPHPFLIRLGENLGLRYYGLSYLLGFVAGWWLLGRYHRAGRSPLDPTMVMDLMMSLVIGVMVGGRLGYFLLYHPADLFNPPWAFFQVWQGGMASHGGFVGVIVATWWFCRSRQLPYLRVTDAIVTTVPVGLGLGRIANFMNGELWGKTTDVPWAMIFHQTGGGILPRHPSQLYEAALEGLLLFALMQWRYWKSEVAQRQPGRVSGEFLIAYALLRIVGEFFREPDAALILGLSRGMFYSLFLAAGGLVVVTISFRRRSQHKS